MSTKKEVWKKDKNNEMKFIGYLPTEDVVGYPEYSEKIADINEQIKNVKDNYLDTATYEQYKDDLQHDVGFLSTRVSSTEASINTLNSEVGDRYTKAESDSKLDEAVKTINTNINTLNSEVGDRYTKAESDLAYVHAGALRYSEINSSYIGSVEGSTGSSPYINDWDALIRIEHRNGANDGPSYKTEIITNLVGHGDLFWRKTIGNPNAWGNWKTIIDSYNLDSFLTKHRLTSDLGFGAYQPNITWGSMASGYTPLWGSDNLHGGGIHFAEKDGQTSMQIDGTFRQREGQYEVIDTSTIRSQHVSAADTYTYGRIVFLGANSVNENTSWVKAVFGDEGHDYPHILAVRTNYTAPEYLLGNFSSGVAWKGDDTYGALTVRYDFADAYICGGNGTSPRWGAHVVLSSEGSDISKQSVAYAEKSGYANAAGEAGVCSSTTLLKAEGTNLGAKIQSQYTSGAIGNVTYNQATWYVIGNDGDTYNFSKMITTDNFNTKLTGALKNTKIEYSTRSDYADFLDCGNFDSTSISISYDDGSSTCLKYISYPKLTINNVTGYGVLEGNVYDHGSFQLAVSDNSNGMIYVRNVAKNGSAPAWKKLLTDGDVVDNLDSNTTNRPLSARQGKVLKEKIASIPTLPSWAKEVGFRNSSDMYLTNFFCGTFSKQTSYSPGGDYMLDITIEGASFGRGNWYATASPCGVNGSTGDWSTQFTVTCSILNSSTIRVWFHCLNGSNSNPSTNIYCNVVAIKYY